MSIKLNALNVFIIVTVAALLGMVMGGLFGFGFGQLAPDVVLDAIEQEDADPVGAATALGAFGGVLCGAALGAFGVVVQSCIALIQRYTPTPRDSHVA